MKKDNKKFDVYQAITDRLIAQLEQGIIPWKKPWKPGEAAVSGTTGREYSGINQMLLPAAGKYYTFRQAQEMGAHVKKGEKGNFVVFWKKAEHKETLDDGTEKTVEIPVLRYYYVFHESQVDGVPSTVDSLQVDQIPAPDAAVQEAARIARNYLQMSGVTLKTYPGGRESFYSPTNDEISLPEIGQFFDQAKYYSTLFHEMTHSTGHEKRLNRDLGGLFGSQRYAKEELVAEMGAAILTGAAGLETSATFENSAAYLQAWISRLQQDKRLAVSAASKAQKAAAYILSAPDAQEVETC